MKNVLARRLGALAVSGALAASAALVTAAPTQAADPEAKSAGWLAGQLDDGLMHNDQFDFDDYGLTADAAFALDAVGGSPERIKQIRQALSRRLESWTTGADFGSDDIYAGSTAKAVVLAQTVDRDPRSFGGVDLVAQLNRRVSTEGATKGRIQDKSATDFANTIGQAFAVQGLKAAGSPKAASAQSFLLKQQCANGYFRLGFAPADQGAQGCDGGTGAQSAPDTDATALALISLQSLPKPGPAVRAAIADGTAWLTRQQRSNGSFGGGVSTEAPNSNSTGLAAWALGEAGDCRPAQRAAAWVADLRLANGAIAYDRAALQAGKDGISVAERDQWRRATAQAAPGLAYLSLKACQA